MNTLRRSFKKKTRDPLYSEFQDGISQFQLRSRIRESTRAKRRDGRILLVHQQIQKEQNIIDATTKLIQICNNPMQQIEARKALLLSEKRLEWLQSNGVKNCVAQSPSWKLAEISISDMRVPVAWNPDHLLRDVGDTSQFVLFALISCQGQIYDTTLVYPVDRQVTDVSFPDVISLSMLPPDFQVTISFYSCQLNQDQSAKKALIKLIKSKFIGSQRKEKLSSEFTEIAACTLELQDTSNTIQCYPLTSTPGLNRQSTVPTLFGQICCRLAARPYSATQCTRQGTLSISWPESEIVVPNCYAELVDWTLKVWTSQGEYRSSALPWKSVRLDNKSTVREDETKFRVENEQEERADFKCESEEDREGWVDAVYQQIESYEMWKNAAETKMEIFSPGLHKPTNTRKMTKKTNSKLLLMYNRISAVNIQYNNL